MKKSNALMLSYIIFLLVSLLARIIFKWDGVGNIARAATIAGCFFAFSDLANWYCSYLNYYINSLREIMNYVTQTEKIILDTTLYKIKESDDVVASIASYRDKHENFEEFLGYFRETSIEENRHKEESQQRLAELEEGKNEIEKHLKPVNVMKTIELVLITLGFIVFFMIIVFEKIDNILIAYQDFATIIAFIIIMLNYFLKDVIETNLKQELDDMTRKAQINKENMTKIDEEFKQTNLYGRVKALIGRIQKLDNPKKME